MAPASDARRRPGDMSRYAVLFAVVASVVVLGGCYEETTPTRYEPGVYKGADDPLLAVLEDGDLHEDLENRFEEAFRDR